MTELASGNIAGLILAGGEGRRFGGADKGLEMWQERPMAAWVLDALAEVVSPVIISANRSLESYRALSPEVVQDDDRYRWQGPLAGLLAGLRHAGQLGYRAVVVSPCDTPALEPELVARLCHAWEAEPTKAVYAACEGRQHPLHGVYPVSAEAKLNHYLVQGERRVQGFTHDIGARQLDCDHWRLSFANHNSPGEPGH